MNYVGLELTGYQLQKIKVVSYLKQFNRYQCEEINANGIVTTPLYSKEEIEKLLNKQDELKRYEKEQEKLREKEIEENKKKEQEESIGNFMIDDPKQHARAKKILNVVEKVDGEYMKRKDKIKMLLKNGYKPEIKNIRTWGKNKITNKHNVPVMINDNYLYEVTKTEYNYALWLLENENLYNSD